MANIQPYINAIQNAVYGEEVRGSICNALTVVNDDNNSYAQIKQDILDAKAELEEEMDDFSDVLAEAKTVKTSLESDIASATSLESALESAISTGNTTKNNLVTATTNAETKKGEVNTAISNANTAISNANTAKTELNTTIDNATTAKTQLNTAISSAATAKTNLETAISTAGTSKSNLENAIASANSAKSDLQAVITSAGTAQSSLSSVLSQATAALSDLQSAITTSQGLKTDLINENATALSHIDQLDKRLENADEILTGVEDIKAYLGYVDEDIVGVQVDYQNKTFKRLAGAYGKNAGSDFDVFEMFGGRKRCNVANDGTINAYYGDDGYIEDGSNGQVMVYQPAFYYKVVPLKVDRNTTGIGYHIRKANYYVSTRPKYGFKLHPAFYDGNGNEVDYILLSAYEGSMWDASEEKYINDSVDTSIAYAAGDLLCSVAGKKPISGLRNGMGTKANYEAMSNNRGAGWHLETIKATSANQLLMIIELGMMNTQTGIGQGVVSITDNSSYNCSSLTGSTGSLGNGTGSAASTVNEKGGVETTETASEEVSVTYRGMENPWGNIWKHIQGVNIWGDGTMAGGQPFVCDDLSSFNESSHSGHYEGAGFCLANADGYINAMGYGNPDFDWLLMPSEIGGTSSLPVGDYLYRTTDLNGYRVALLGGVWVYGGGAGGFCWACDSGVGYRARFIGGRLLYVPTATV